MSDFSCKICESSDKTLHYKGLIRMGRVGSLSPEHQEVWRCNNCHAAWLLGGSVDYDSSEYRDMVDGGADVETFYKLHDADQAPRILLVGTDKIRGKVLADIGCGAGAFMDMIRGFASETIVIEPGKSFHPTLKQKGHRVYPYLSDALLQERGKVDVATCLSVIEHIEEPLAFLSEVRQLLKPGGKLLLVAPNRNDWLLELLPKEYGEFFYRHVHRWYFDEKSFKSLGKLAGFSAVETFFDHRYDLSNLILWMRDRRPTGNGKISVSPMVNAAFRESLIQGGKSDSLCAWLTA